MNPIDIAAWTSTIVMVGTFIFAAYELWLNYTQAKVKTQMDELIQVVKEINQKIKEV